MNDQRDEQTSVNCGAADTELSDCDEAVRQLYAFMDNELTEQLRVTFEAHLNACGPCVEIVSFEAELRRIIANRCQDRVPDELRNRIASLISKEANRLQ